MDSKLAARFIIEAASHLQMARLPSAVCAETILNALINDADASYRDSALYPLAQMYRVVSPDQASRILAAIEGLLKDPSHQRNVRFLAGHVLAQIGAASSIDAFNTAIAREQDPNTKASLQKDLVTLQRKQ